jgi:hypothetical protein
VPEHDRVVDADRVAEGADVVGAGLEAPRGSIPPGGPAVPAQVEVDHLRALGEPGEVRFEVGVVVDPGTAVNKNHGWVLPQLAAVGYEFRRVDVEP